MSITLSHNVLFQWSISIYFLDSERIKSLADYGRIWTRNVETGEIPRANNSTSTPPFLSLSLYRYYYLIYCSIYLSHSYCLSVSPSPSLIYFHNIPTSPSLSLSSFNFLSSFLPTLNPSCLFLLFLSLPISISTSLVSRHCHCCFFHQWLAILCNATPSLTLAYSFHFLLAYLVLSFSFSLSFNLSLLSCLSPLTFSHLLPGSFTLSYIPSLYPSLFIL